MTRHVTTGIPALMAASSATLSELATGWARFFILVVGGLLTLAVGRFLLQRRKYESIKARMDMCRSCQKMNGGAKNCSVDPQDRPPHCPAGRQPLEGIH